MNFMFSGKENIPWDMEGNLVFTLLSNIIFSGAFPEYRILGR